NTSVAIIQNGSRPHEKLGVGTVSTISEIVREKELSSPAIIIIGEIVRYAKEKEIAGFVREYAKY
ncbi:MAG: hypothetical protein KAQ62_07720, partial [Cyclobacteriaceae bacterium]|nr:hypothetical protein [Cyclobacteriaceae bacterium]